MHKIVSAIALVLLLLGNAQAGEWEPREEAIKNLASGYAFMVLCSINGDAQTAPVARLGEAYLSRMTKGAYEKFRDQYQRSLHEKTMYSIASKKWVPFKVAATECGTVDRSVDMYLQRLTNVP